METAWARGSCLEDGHSVVWALVHNPWLAPRMGKEQVFSMIPGHRLSTVLPHAAFHSSSPSGRLSVLTHEAAGANAPNHGGGVEFKPGGREVREMERAA